MLIPLGFLAAGSILSGYPFKEVFAGHGVDGVLPRLAQVRATATISSKPCITCPTAIAMLPTVMMGLGLRRRVGLLYPAARAAGRTRAPAPAALQVPAQQVVLRRALRSLLVRPTLWLGRFLWKHGDGWLIDGLGPDGVSARVLDVTRGVSAAADRLPLSLCLRHADRRRGADHLVHVRRPGGLMMSWPILSVTTFLPLVGALFIMMMRARRRCGEAQRALDRALDDADHVRDLAHHGLSVRPDLGRVPVRREAAVARRRDHLPHGRRRHFAAVRDC